MTMFIYPLPYVRIVEKAVIRVLTEPRLLLLAEHADAGTPTMISILGPTHRVEIPPDDTAPLSMMALGGILLDTMRMTTLRILHVGATEDIIHTATSQNMGMVEVTGITLGRRSPKKTQANTLPSAVPVAALVPVQTPMNVMLVMALHHPEPGPPKDQVFKKAQLQLLHTPSLLPLSDWAAPIHVGLCDTF